MSFCSFKLTMSLELVKSCHLQNSVNSKHACTLINMTSITFRLINTSVFLKCPACVVQPDCSLISLQAWWAAFCFASFALFPCPSGYSFPFMTTLYTNLKKKISVFRFQLKRICRVTASSRLTQGCEEGLVSQIIWNQALFYVSGSSHWDVLCSSCQAWSFEIRQQNSNWHGLG